MPKGGGGTGASGGSSLPTVKLGKGDIIWGPPDLLYLTTHIVDAQQGNDTLDLHTFSQGIYLTVTNYTGGSQSSISSLSLEGYQGIAGFDWAWGYSNYAGPGNIFSNTIKGFENFLLGSGDDWFVLNDNADNIIDGGGGDDVLKGNYGADIVIGGEGNDYLDSSFGMGGILVGGTWDDPGNLKSLPTGDGFSDTFWSGTILDFELGLDRLQILVSADGVDNYLAGTWVETTWNGLAAVELVVDGYHTSQRLVGISPEEASTIQLDFEIAAGPAGEIEGAGGDDVIYAGPNADTFVFHTGSGNDTIVYDSRYFSFADDRLSFPDEIAPPQSSDWDQTYVHGQEGIIYYFGNGDSVTILGLTLADADKIQFA